jgi:hypothetical protein
MSKKTAIPLDTKVKILSEVNKGRKKSEVAAEFGIPRSTLSTIIKSGNHIEGKLQSGNVEGARKRLRSATHDDVDKALLQWFRQIREVSLPVNGPILLEKAPALAVELGCHDFHPSNGWLGRWKDRHGIHLRNVCGEAAAVKQESVQMWLTTTLPQLLTCYQDSDIYNADETGLFWRMLPDKSLNFKGETCTGGKQSKERITVLLAANMTGTSKLKPLVIGKAKTPR